MFFFKFHRYAACIAHILTNTSQEARQCIQERGRDSVNRFSEKQFQIGWIRNLESLVNSAKWYRYRMNITYDTPYISHKHRIDFLILLVIDNRHHGWWWLSFDLSNRLHIKSCISKTTLCSQRVFPIMNMRLNFFPILLVSGWP